jgi:hypothetical protein
VHRALAWLAAAGMLTLGLLLAAACTRDGDRAVSTSSAVAANLATPAQSPAATENEALIDPGFETPDSPWHSLDSPEWKPMQRSTSFAHTGQGSVELDLVGSEDNAGTRVVGALEDLRPPAFPKHISGYYFVRSFDRGTPIQYVQAVIIAIGTDLPDFSSHQIRYVLTGLDAPPFTLTNARFRLMGPKNVTTSTWIRFDLPVADDFAQLWGQVPTRFDSIRVLFETRYDAKVTGTETSAVVFFDDLSVAY